jgi:prepilin-type N-terminal cleavage/methylation domain-containing protein
MHGWEYRKRFESSVNIVGGLQAMTSTVAFPQGRARKGFSLVELSVVVIIIGVLAAFGVPRLLQSVERSKASESFKYLASVRAAQERYQARQGTYADDLTKLDLVQTAPTYFTVGTVGAVGSGSLENTWQLTLTRAGSSGGYGSYTVTFNHDGYDSGNSDIVADVNPQGT